MMVTSHHVRESVAQRELGSQPLKSEIYRKSARDQSIGPGAEAEFAIQIRVIIPVSQAPSLVASGNRSPNTRSISSDLPSQSA